MTAAPPRPTDLPLADQLRLAEWMAAWPLLSEDEARQELGLAVAEPATSRCGGRMICTRAVTVADGTIRNLNL